MRNAGTSEVSNADTTEPHRKHHTLRRIGAVLAGLLAIIILSIATDLALYATGVFPPFGQRIADALLLLATAYRSVYAVAGSYIAARLAPSGPCSTRWCSASWALRSASPAP